MAKRAVYRILMESSRDAFGRKGTFAASPFVTLTNKLLERSAPGRVRQVTTRNMGKTSGEVRGRTINGAPPAFVP